MAGHEIFIVDDKVEICRVVASAVETLGCQVSYFTNAADCLEKLSNKHNCSLLITDVKMPDMDGLTLLSKAKKIAPWIPVMVISGYGDIPMALEAMKLGAVDFIEKPLDRNSFLCRVKSVLNKDNLQHSVDGKSLTKTEKKVLKMILDGKGNKEIAYILGRGLRTVEFHRSHIMKKFDVDNIVDLVKKAIPMNMDENE